MPILDSIPFAGIMARGLPTEIWNQQRWNLEGLHWVLVPKISFVNHVLHNKEIRIKNFCQRWTRAWLLCFLKICTGSNNSCCHCCLCCPSFIGPIFMDELIEEFFILWVDNSVKSYMSLRLLFTLSKWYYPLSSHSLFGLNKCLAFKLMSIHAIISIWANSIKCFYFNIRCYFCQTAAQLLSVRRRKNDGLFGVKIFKLCYHTGNICLWRCKTTLNKRHCFYKDGI